MERFANSAQTTISQLGGISPASLSVTVASVALFPTSPQFRIRIGNELMLVTGIIGNTFTITRGEEGSAIASHAFGAIVTHILTAGGLSQYAFDIMSHTGPVGPQGSPGVMGPTGPQGPPGLSVLQVQRALLDLLDLLGHRVKLVHSVARRVSKAPRVLMVRPVLRGLQVSKGHRVLLGLLVQLEQTVLQVL
jgi:hypothetical protein